MPQSGRDEEWLRAQLHNLGGPDTNHPPLKPLHSTYTPTWSPADDDQAVLSLFQASEMRKNGEVKSLSNVSKFKHDKLSFEDYESVLQQVVGPTSISVGVIASVLRHLSDSQPKRARTGSLKFRRSVKENDVSSLMSSLMKTSLTHNQLDQLRVLAHAARSAGRSDAVSRVLPTAVQTDDSKAVEILIEEGADTNTCPLMFAKCVAAGKLGLIRLLLRSQTTVYHETTTSALPVAVKLGDIETVQLLLAHGANAGFQNGLALKHAIDNHRLDLIILLLLSQSHPAESTLASMTLYVWTERDKFAGRRGQIIQTFLNGGACGNDVDAILSGAVEEERGELVQLLMSKGTSITSFNGQAYRQAIHAVNHDMLQILDTDKLGEELATDIFGSLYTTRHGAEISPQDWSKLATHLLAQGAAGDIIDEALINRVTVRDLDGVELLLLYGASVDYKDGRALGIAVSSEDMDYILPILHRGPKTDTINAIFDRVVGLSHRDQLDITRKLMEAGASGAALDEVLALALTVPACQRDHTFIKTLVNGGASVGQQEGFLIREVVRDGDLKTLAILLRGVFPPAIAFGCIPLAMDLDERRQYKILEALLATGIRGGPLIAQALVDSIDEGKPSVIRVAELLLTAGAADTTFNDGEAFKKAIRCHTLDFVQLLVPFNYLNAPQFCSCLGVAIGLPRDDMRLEKVKLLLTAGVDMSSEHWSTILGSEMVFLCATHEESSSVLRFLLDSGADINYQHGAIVCSAIKAGMFEVFKMYLGCPLTAQSQEAAFKAALAYAIDKNDLRFMREMLQLETPADLLNMSLVVAANIGECMKELCELLLEHHASPSYASGAPLCYAIKSRLYHSSMVELLLRFQPTTEAISVALDCAFDTLQGQQRLAAVNLLLTAAKPQQALDKVLLKAVQEDSWDPYLLKALLRANASALYNDGECILYSVMKNDVGLLHILQPYFANGTTFVSRMFKTAWKNGARASHHAAALCVLLKAGATGKWLSIALADTIETFDASTNSMALILSLLSAGADVNYDNGISLVKASANGNLRVLNELFLHDPNRDNMKLAFQHIFTSGVDNAALHDLVQAFCSHSSRPDLTDSGHILHLLLKNYPTAKVLLKFLIDAGCPAEYFMVTNQGAGVSLLYWALASNLADEIIDILLSGGANTNYKTTSNRTPLELAISASRRHTVASLLRHGADPTVLSGTTSPKSLLYLAVTTENHAIVRLIMLASLDIHDGALHYAAREVNVKVLEILILEGQQKDYAYSGCDGRTALAELCLKADGNKSRNELARAMALLKDSHSLRKKSNGKSALHFALDNRHESTVMTRALLDSVMGEYINDDINLFEEDGLVYSPLAYVLKGRNKAPKSNHRDALVKVLTQFGCKNRFWALEGSPQPQDVINPPDNIARIINQQKDHERMLERIRSQSEAAQSAIAAQHELLLKNELELSDLRSKLERKEGTRSMISAANRHSTELAHIQQLAGLSNGGYHGSTDSLLSQYAKSARERRQAEIDHLTKQQTLLTAAYKDRAAIEQKNREANAREMRRLRELWYETDPWD
ncbi:hypothetical protein BJX64DRAFT_294123 [Aspergillus heterothallicus]